MSWLSSAIHGVGHLAEKAAPYVGLIPGVGTLAGGVIGGLGGLAAGDGLGGAIKYGLEGAAGGYGGAALRGLSTGQKALAVGTAALKGGIPGAPGASPTGQPTATPPYSAMDPNGGDGTGTDPLGGIDYGGILKGVVNSATGSGSPQGGATNPWLLGLAGLEGANSAYLGKKSSDLSNAALKNVQGSYAERAPLRTMALQGLTHPTIPDVSGLERIRSSNPYAQVQSPPPLPPGMGPGAGSLMQRLAKQQPPMAA